MTVGQFRWLPSLRDLDEEQNKVIHNSLNKGSNLIYGPAGCGKTAITLYCAKTLQDMGKNYLVFLYTDVLTQFVRAATQDLGIPDDRVRRFYQWVYHEHRSRIGEPPNGGDDKFSIWVDNLIRYYQNYPGQTPHYDFILVDEAQDFKSNVSRLLHLMSNNIYVAGDTAQSLYSGASSVQDLVGMWQPVSEKYQLINNYRNPKTIAQVAVLFLDRSSMSADDFLRRVKGRDYEMKPVLYQVGNTSEQTDKIVQIIREARGSERVGILCRHRQQVTTEASNLQRCGIQVQVALSREGFYNFRSTLPTVTTVHSAKGLEFDWVILPYLTVESWDNVKDDEAKNRKAFFVALTRTKNRLYLISIRGQECGYLRDIVTKAPNLLQTPTNTTTPGRPAAAAYQDEDPF